MPAMTNYRIDSEEEALFRSYPYAIYYVQSPSTISHANSADIRNVNNELDLYHSPLPSEPCCASSSAITNGNQEPIIIKPLPVSLSRYSSSHGSNTANSLFLQDNNKKGSSCYQSQGNGSNTLGEMINKGRHYSGRRNGGDYEDEEEEEEEEEEDHRWWTVLAFGNSSSLGWKCVQVTWRFMVSMAVALTVFYIVTRPPPPKVSLEMGRIQEFELAEGVDRSGVSTKILTCNCTMRLVIDNKSKIFGLHIHPPQLEMFFGTLSFAMSREGTEVVAEARGLTYLRMTVGTRSKAMYGAGRNMQDLLESNKGLPLTIRVNLSSRFRVVWGLINPKFHHQLHCFVLLANHYDKKHRTHKFISRCSTTS